MMKSRRETNKVWLEGFTGICKLGHACLKTSEQRRLVASVDDDQMRYFFLFPALSYARYGASGQLASNLELAT